MESVDILIAGGGPVGTALAHALSDLPAMGRSVLQVAEAPPPDIVARNRPISLAWGSRLLLERLGLWSGLPVSPIERIHVSQRHRFGRTLISASDHRVAALGYVTNYAALAGLPSAEGIPRVAGRFMGWERQGDRVLCRIAEAQSTEAQHEVSARLLVLAEGGAVRHGARTASSRASAMQPRAGVARNNSADETGGTSADQDYWVKDYGQSAVVCTLTTQHSESGTAFERFTKEGPIALLPFRAPNGNDCRALVWSARTTTADALMALDDQAFLAALQEAFGSRLGRFAAPGKRVVFPLSLRYKRSIAEHGVIAIGNAAQALHPVAAQGLNLGLRDAWELAELLLAGDAEPESEQLASRYAERRRIDRLAMTRITDGMVSAFGLQGPLAGAARGAALMLLDVLPPARRVLSRRMMFGMRGFP